MILLILPAEKRMPKTEQQIVFQIQNTIVDTLMTFTQPALDTDKSEQSK